MTYYPTTLLPPSPPYDCLDDIITVLVDRCIIIHDNMSIPEHDKQQYFDITMTIIEFWDFELSGR